MLTRNEIRPVPSDQDLEARPREPAAERADFEGFVTAPSLWMPDHLVPSAWHEHAPFAFWLVEATRPELLVELGTHNGFSYFAFCQALQRLGIDATAYAIDTWEGDEQAGFYDEEVFRAVEGRNAAYGSFSRLVRSTFEAARERFQDGSIDLLHIDGRHFYDDVRRDFETWLPKLSDRGVVLLHDTNVREPGFGVATLWHEIRGAYPSFEFLHGYGLGVLGVGSSLPDPVRRLLGCSNNTARRIRSVYARLGSGVGDRFAAAAAAEAAQTEKEALSAEAHRLEENWQAQVEESDRLRGHVLRLEHERDRYVIEVERLLGHIQRFERERDVHMAEAAHLSDEIRRLERMRDHAAAEQHELRSLVAERDAQLGQAMAETAQLRIAYGEIAEQRASLQQHAEAIEEARRQLAQELEDLRGTAQAAAVVVHELGADLATARGEVEHLRSQFDESQGVAQELRRELQESRSALEQETARSERRAAALRTANTAGEAISTSTTWNATAPLRRAAQRSPAAARVLRRAAQLLGIPVSVRPAPGSPSELEARDGSPTLVSSAPAMVEVPPESFTAVDGMPMEEGLGADPALEMPAPTDRPDVHAVVSPELAEAPVLVEPAPDGTPEAAAADLSSAEPEEVSHGGESPPAVEVPISEGTPPDTAVVELPPSDGDTSPILPLPEAAAPVSDALAPEAPAPVPGVLPGDVAHRLDFLQARVDFVASAMGRETHRLDHVLARTEGVLDTIDDYHAARESREYRAAFLENQPLVSVCVATVDRSEILVERCLRSLVHQTYRNLQIVVVGDHCTDDTEQRVADLRDSRIVFRNLDARGPYPAPGRDRWCVAGSNAMNTALSLCEGQFVTHLDDDDSAVADRIETLVAAAQQNQADFCWHQFWIEAADGTWGRIGNGRLELGEVTTSSIFYHRYFRSIEWDVFAYRLQEPGDWNRIRKIKMLRPRMHFVDRPLVFHHAEESQGGFVQRPGETFLG